MQFLKCLFDLTFCASADSWQILREIYVYLLYILVVKYSREYIYTFVLYVLVETVVEITFKIQSMKCLFDLTFCAQVASTFKNHSWQTKFELYTFKLANTEENKFDVKSPKCCLSAFCPHHWDLSWRIQ